jgi:hypothetical protein
LVTLHVGIPSESNTNLIGADRTAFAPIAAMRVPVYAAGPASKRAAT